MLHKIQNDQDNNQIQGQWNSCKQDINDDKFKRIHTTTEAQSQAMRGIRTQGQSSQMSGDKNFDYIVVTSSDSDEDEQQLKQYFINNLIKNQNTQENQQSLSKFTEFNGLSTNPLKQQIQQRDLYYASNISNPTQVQQKPLIHDLKELNSKQKEEEMQQKLLKFYSFYSLPEELLNNYQEFKKFQQFLSISELYQQNTQINCTEAKEQSNQIKNQQPQQSQIPIQQTKYPNSTQNYFSIDEQALNQNSQQQNSQQQNRQKDQQKKSSLNYNQQNQGINCNQTKQSQNLDKYFMKQQQIEKYQQPFLNIATNSYSVEKNQNQQNKKSQFMDFSQIQTFLNYEFNENSLQKSQRRKFIVTINYSDSGRILAWFMRKFNFSLLGIIIFNFRFKYNILVIQLLDQFKIHESNVRKEFGRCQLLHNIVDNSTISNIDKFCSLQLFMSDNYHYILDSEEKKKLNFYYGSFITGKYFEFMYDDIENVQIKLDQIQKIQKWSQISLGKQNDHTMIFQVDKKLIIYFIRKKCNPVIMKHLLSQIHQPFQITVLHDNIEFSKLDDVLIFYHRKYNNIQSLIIPQLLRNMDIKQKLKQNPNKFIDLYDNIYMQEIFQKQN